MDRQEAYEIDRGHGAYSDLDEETGLHCVFGAKSGFCYGTYSDVGEAADAGVELHEELVRAGLN